MYSNISKQISNQKKAQISEAAGIYLMRQVGILQKSGHQKGVKRPVLFPPCQC